MTWHTFHCVSCKISSKNKFVKMNRSFSNLLLSILFFNFPLSVYTDRKSNDELGSNLHNISVLQSNNKLTHREIIIQADKLRGHQGDHVGYDATLNPPANIVHPKTGTNSHRPQHLENSNISAMERNNRFTQNRQTLQKNYLSFQNNLKNHRTTEPNVVRKPTVVLKNPKPKETFNVNIEEDENEYKPSKHLANKQKSVKAILVKLLERSEHNKNFAEVLPILKVMSPAQRLAMASLVTNQITSEGRNSRLNLAQVKSMFGNNVNITSDLMLPIMLDIANMFRSLKDRYKRLPEKLPQAQLLKRSFSDSDELHLSDVAELFSPDLLMRRMDDGPIEEETDDGNYTIVMDPDGTAGRPKNVSFDGKKAENISKKNNSSLAEDLPIAEELRFKIVDRHGGQQMPRPLWVRNKPSGPPQRRMSTEQLRRIAEQRRINSMEKAKCELFTETLCLDAIDYPSHAINLSILKNLNAMGALHSDFPDMSADTSVDGVSAKQEVKYTPEHYINNINRREDNTERPKDASGFMCPSTVKYARPQKARATSGQWKYIVNTGEHTQTLRLEKCLRPKESCTFLTDNFKSKCVQVYNYHRLLTWDQQNGLHMDIFKVPTCCSCHIDGYNFAFPPNHGHPNEVTSERFPGEDLSHEPEKSIFGFPPNFVKPSTKDGFSNFRGGNSDYIPSPSSHHPEFQEQDPSLHDLKHLPVPNQFSNINNNFHTDILQQQDSNIRNIKKPFREPTVELPSFLEPPSKPVHNTIKSSENPKFKIFGTGHHKRGVPGSQPTILKRPVRKPLRKKNSHVEEDQQIGASNIHETPTKINSQSQSDEVEETIRSTIPYIRSHPSTSRDHSPSEQPPIIIVSPTTDRNLQKSTTHERGPVILKDMNLNRRVNYNYHPIIDFFEESSNDENKKASDRIDNESTYIDQDDSDWRPMTAPIGSPLIVPTTSA